VTLPDDQEGRLRCYRNALRNWNFRGYVDFRPRPQEDLRHLLPGLSLREIVYELHKYVESGGKIDEKLETRPLECADDAAQEFRYDLRVVINERRIYFETVLLCDDPDDPDDPRIQVVSVH
jgi:hypothetical protein